jgi:hypothetical protein
MGEEGEFDSENGSLERYCVAFLVESRSMEKTNGPNGSLLHHCVLQFPLTCIAT